MTKNTTMCSKQQLLVVKELTGIRPAMVPFGLRIPVEQAKILHKAAREKRCNGADLLRTAWDEYIVNHNLKGE